MSARIQPSVTEWVAWVEAEALVSGWLSVRPYAKPNNRAGAPEVLLARDGRNVAIWVRPVTAGLTKAQAQWATAMTGTEHPTPTEQVCGRTDEGDLGRLPVVTVLAHPTAADRDLMRELLS